MNLTNITANVIIDIYNQPSPTPCWQLKIVGAYCIILFCSSVTFNSLLLAVFIRNPELRTSLNTLIFAITILNLLSTISELPFATVSTLSCRWMFGKTGCFVSAFIMYFAATTNIYLMTIISFERFYVIYKPLSMKDVTIKTSLIAIGFCVLNGLLWALFPFVGWSYYSPEGALTSCSVEWKERTNSVISYNVVMFVLVYLVPLVLIVGSNAKLLLILKSMPKFKGAASSEQNKKKMDTERALTKIMILLIGAFIISWTPYALVALYAAFIDADSILPIFGTLPAMFAKSSQLWTSLLYIVTNKQIREKVAMFIPTKIGPVELSLSRNQSIEPGPRTTGRGAPDINQNDLEQNSILHNVNRRMSNVETQIAARVH